MPDYEDELVTRAQTAWFAVSTRSRQERPVASILDHLGIPTFLPLVTETHRWSDREKKVRVPLFPSYLFAQGPASKSWQIRVRRAKGVVGIVGNARGPVAVPDKEMEAIRCIWRQELPISRCVFQSEGKRVRIVGGELNGMEGILSGTGAEARLLFSIALIQRSVSISALECKFEATGGSSGIAA